MARLVPLQKQLGDRKPGAWKGKITYTADAFAPLTDKEITVEQSVRAGLVPVHHRDPFDRLLVAQAQLLDMPIASADAELDRYEVTRLW